MNPLIFDDLFISICQFLSINNIIGYELISTFHTKLIRNTPWYQEVKLKNIMINYQFKNINLSNTYIIDVSQLGNCHTLNLSNTKVSDVSQLGNCHTLNLSYTKVIDVSQLGNCHTLNLSSTKVIDVSQLGNCHTLKF